MTTRSEVNSVKSGFVGPCPHCNRTLPLRHPEPGETAPHWFCTGCERPIQGILLEEWSAEFLRNVRPAGVAANFKLLGELLGRQPETESIAVAASSDRSPERPQDSLPARHGAKTLWETKTSRKLDAQIDRGDGLALRPQGTPFSKQVVVRIGQPYDVKKFQIQASRLTASLEHMCQLFERLAEGQTADLATPQRLLHESLIQAAGDLDLFVSLGINPRGTGQLERHGLHVAMLAMSMGSMLDWDQPTLLDLGIGCLVHDIGMRRVNPPSYLEPRVLDEMEFGSIARHPIHTLEMLAHHTTQLSAPSRMVAYQMHERCDGSGYPRGRTAKQIHPLAKIAAVADAFVALVSRRPHRPALAPYRAVCCILDGVRQGAFSPPAVRALLQAVSLFPLGSLVRLSDGRTGRVIRSNRQRYDRPTIEMACADVANRPAQVLDLAQMHGLRVIDTFADEI